ncbi:MAG: phosphotransferase [Dehalococcoidia bacterium]|nr:phosphotransferase [Dehalococcoidia bacterium]
MPATRMHVDEPDIDVPLVRRLLAAQFPRWADITLDPVVSTGTDNAIYRLGDDMAVRLLRREQATAQVEREHRWLPRLAPHLPLAIPVPLEIGAPGEGYPWPWAVNRWLDGENTTLDRLADPRQAATDLAQFIEALHRVDSTGGPPAGPASWNRGLPLSTLDASVRKALAALHGTIDVPAATAAWDAALKAPEWDGPPTWLHGDLQSGNLLARDGRLVAVIDFGCMAVGDPACDLSVAWTLLDAGAREVFRSALTVDEATWARGRGWALYGVVGLVYYRETSPALVAACRYAVEEVLADQRRGG